MTKVLHIIEKNELQGDSENPCFLLSNKKGGYASLSNAPLSRFQGIFFNDNFDMIKVIENITPLDTPEVTRVINRFCCIQRERQDCKEEFFMPLDKDSFVYTVSDGKYIELDLDVRKSYDMREFGRYYSIYEEKGKIIVEFTKKTDNKEDSSEGIEELKVYIAMNKADYSIIGQFHAVDYPYDRERNSQPSQRYVYKALRMKGEMLVFSFSKDKQKAISENDEILKNIDILKKTYKNHIAGFRKNIKDADKRFAYTAACNSLHSAVQTIQGTKGIYAGYWWFFQFWARDEAISLKALMMHDKFLSAKDILFRLISRIMEDGRIPNRYPESKLASADGVGWAFKRVTDLVEILQLKEVLLEYLSHEEILFLRKQLQITIQKLIENHTKDDLAVNSGKETWMDTDIGNDSRSGARIEIQALQLNMYKLLKILCRAMKDKEGYELSDKLEKRLRDKVRKMFWNGSYLNDGIDDPTIRPNIFIAYYIYPELLTQDQWVRCFDTAMPKLWDEWGGISTIDKSHPLFCDHYTGEDNRSYHRGDSWFWLNNLAALCLARADNVRFKEYISKIADASTREILWSGMIGHHAELSSSKELCSKGCLSQSWSNAMYIELIDELF